MQMLDMLREKKTIPQKEGKQIHPEQNLGMALAPHPAVTCFPSGSIS